MNESTAPRSKTATSRGIPTAQAVLIVSTLLGSWLGMQGVHEFGHVAGAWLTGGQVERVVLHPLTISRTDVSPNPKPLLVVWAGPLVGVLAPVLAWTIAAWRKWGAAFIVRFFAGFCLVANGLYLGVGSFWSIGDCGVMLQHGASHWHLWLFGAIAVPAGFGLWNRQGKHFSLGPDARPVSSRVAWGTCAVAGMLLAVGFVVAGS